MNLTTRMLARGVLAALLSLPATLSHGVHPAGAAPFAPPAPVVRTLPNGLRVAVFADHRLPLVQMELLLPAGGALDPPSAPGVAHATAQLLRAGTSSRTGGAFAADVAFLAGIVEPGATRDYTSVSATFLAADFDAGLELLADAVVNPVFPPEEVDRFRMQAAQQRLPERLPPSVQAENLLWSLAFEGHPYSRDPMGTVESLSRIGREAVRAFHGDYYRPDRAVLAIAGDVDPERAFAVVDDHFGSWAGRFKQTPRPAPPAPPEAMRIRLVDRPGLAASEVRIGLVCPSRGDADALPLQAAAQILGGGPASRLARARLGGSLPFDAGSGTTVLQDAGLVAVGATVPTDSVGLFVARVRDELARLRDRPPDEAEVAAVRHDLENGYPLQFQAPGAIMTQWLGADFYGLTSRWLEHYIEDVRALTAEQTAAAGARWLDPARCVVIVVGPAERLRKQLEALGPVEMGAPGGGPVAAPADGPKPPAPEQRQRGRELLTSALAAHGGLERLRRVTDSTIEGDMILQVESRTMTMRTRQVRKEPWRMRYSTRFSRLESGQVLDGARGWVYSAGESTTVVPLDEAGVAAARSVFRSDVVHTLLDAVGPGVEVAWLGPGRADGRAADVVEVRSTADVGAGGRGRRLLYLDATDHRLIVEEEGEAAPGGTAQVRRTYRDYRPVGGVLWPHREERMVAGQKTMTLTLETVKLNSGVADSEFSPPGTMKLDLPLR